jgi:hypothetical protein
MNVKMSCRRVECYYRTIDGHSYIHVLFVDFYDERLFDGLMNIAKDAESKGLYGKP